MLIRLKSKYFVKPGAHEAILVGLFKSDKTKFLISSDIDIVWYWYISFDIVWLKSADQNRTRKDFINLLKFHIISYK
jgi:hypothetical protein